MIEQNTTYRTQPSFSEQSFRERYRLQRLIISLGHFSFSLLSIPPPPQNTPIVSFADITGKGLDTSAFCFPVKSPGNTAVFITSHRQQCTSLPEKPNIHFFLSKQEHTLQRAVLFLIPNFPSYWKSFPSSPLDFHLRPGQQHYQGIWPEPRMSTAGCNVGQYRMLELIQILYL